MPLKLSWPCKKRRGSADDKPGDSASGRDTTQSRRRRVTLSRCGTILQCVSEMGERQGLHACLRLHFMAALALAAHVRFSDASLQAADYSTCWIASRPAWLCAKEAFSLPPSSAALATVSLPKLTF